MTKLEFDTFVAEQLQGRWPKWQPTAAMLHDWYAILRYHSLDVATAAVQEHRLSERAVVFEPKINEVAKVLKRHRHKPATGQLGPLYVPWVRCIEAPQDHPEWQGREWVRLEYRFSGSANNRQHVAEAAERTAREIQQDHGGRWCGVVRPDGQVPESSPESGGQAAREWVEGHSSDGPDGPSRRFVPRRHGKYIEAVVAARSIPKEVGRRDRTVASRAEIDALHEPAPHAEQSDAEFFAAHLVEEDDVWEQG